MQYHRLSFYHISEIIRRHAKFVSAILHRRQAECQLHVPVKVIMQQTVEFHQHIRIVEFPGDELAVIETLAEVQNQLNIAHNDGILKFIVPFLEFIPYLAHQRCQDTVFFIGHVQGFIDTVIEKGIILYRLFQRGGVQQVWMEQQCPARQHHSFTVVLFSADLSGGDADDRSLLVVVLPATVCQVYFRFVMKENAIDAELFRL